MSGRPPSLFLDKKTPPHLATLVMVAALSALSMNMFLPSLPSMSDYFATDYRRVQLSVPLYLLMNAVLQIVIGPLSDRYGRRAVLLWTFGLFVLASVGCALATSIEMFLVFRAAQATIASGMVLSRAAVRDMVGREESASMIGYVTMGMAVAPMIGPMVGGVLDQTIGWQANFWLLVGAGALVCALIWFDFGETARPRRISLLAQFGEYPELIGSRRFWGYSMAAAFSAGAFFAFVGGAPLVGEEVFGLTPSELGGYFGLTALGYMIGNYVSGRYSVRLGINRMMITGALLVTFGLSISLILLLSGATHPLAFFGLTSFVGLGNGMVMPNANAGLLSVRPHLAGSASGLGGALMIGGGGLLSDLSGRLLEIGNGIFPLISVMIFSSLLGILCSLYVRHIDRREGPAEPLHPAREGTRAP